MAYTTKSGKTFSNYQQGKAYDDAEQAQDQQEGKKPESKLEPEADDNNGPVIRIVLTQTPEGSFTSDDGQEQNAHDGIDDLIAHLKGRFGASDEPDADDSEAPSSIADSVAAMLGPSK